MPDEARLKQLIEETKTKKLDEFRSSLEEAVSKELCDILELTYTMAKPEDLPIASFPMKSQTWVIMESGLPVSEREHTRWVLGINTGSGDFHRSRHARGFNTRDDLLLLIDTLMQ